MTAQSKRVARGQSFSFPAQNYNRMLSAIEAVESGRLGGGNSNVQRENLILIKNVSGEDKDQYDAIGLGDALVLEPSTAKEDLEFLQEKTLLEGEKLSEKHVGKWCVLVEPIANGEIGKAAVAGPTLARVYVENSYGDSVEIKKNGDDYRLQTTNGGAVELMWLEPYRVKDEGLAYCYINLSAPSPASLLYPVDQTYEDEHQEAAIDKNNYTADIDGDGDEVDVIWYREKPPAAKDEDGNPVSDERARGLKITVSTGAAYYDTSDETLYGYVVDMHYDSSGRLVWVSSERRVTIDVPEDC